MNAVKTLDTINNIDIYLLDQIMKGRYHPNETILDAGCGTGRNMNWFYNNHFKLTAVDHNPERIEFIKEIYPKQKDNFKVASLANLPYENNSVDHIINCAVLHFSENTEAFKLYFSELVRVLKPNGSLFIRMTSDIGIENYITRLSNGIYRLPDNTNRFLLTRKLLNELINEFPISFLEPLKSTNVADLRTMSTLVVSKLYVKR